MAAHSTRRTKPKKPRPDFPLFPHARGYWAKKVRGKLHYFGKVADDPDGDKAVRLWTDQKDYLLAGRTPPSTPADGLTVEKLCNHFLYAKEQQRDAGDIATRTFDEYLSTCKIVVAAFGKIRMVDDLGAADFQDLRARLAKRYGLHRLAKLIQIIRTTFKYGFDAELLDRPVRFGPMFKKPPKRKMRAHRQDNGGRMFEANQLRTIIDAADQPLKAMILLGVNCGFGNHDVGTLPKRAINLEAGWVDFPRPKTAIPRRCKLWPETIEAVKDSLAKRPKARLAEHDDLVFITKYGGPWAKDTPDSPVAKEFRKLLDSIDAKAAKDAKERKAKPAKIHRFGLGFYGLRHVFETIGGETRDQVAVDHIMGHADSSMADEYRERIGDDRLEAVVKRVHAWLWPRPTVG